MNDQPDAIARPAGLDALLGFVAANLPAEDDTPTGQKYPTRLGVYCDTCRITIEGDFLVADTMSKVERLDVVRQHVNGLGWWCDADGDFCPKCLPCAPAIEEQPSPLTMADRNAHAVGLYASTAVELEDARADRDRALAQRNAVFKTNEQLLAQVEEAGRARIRAENEARTLIQQRDRIAHDTMAARATDPEAYPGELVMLRGLLGVLRATARHSDMDEVRRLLAEHASDEQAAYDAQAAEQPAPVTLPYLYTDCDGDQLDVHPATPGTLDTPAVFIAATATDEDDQGAVFLPVAEVPGLLAAITRAAAVATRDHEPKQAEEQPAVPAVGDRYVSRSVDRTVTVTRVWEAEDEQTAVAYEWRDDRPGQCGSACPLDVFHRAYRAEAGR